MKILVTGTAGFIGYHLANFENRVYTRDIFGND